MRDRCPENWKTEIRPAILKRDSHKCKFCGVLNYAVGSRGDAGEFILVRGNILLDLAGQGLRHPSCEKLTHKEARTLVDQLNEDADWCDDQTRYIVIVLTIAHIHDPNPENCDPENLAALYQKYHLHNDKALHAETRRARLATNQIALSLA